MKYIVLTTYFLILILSISRIDQSFVDNKEKVNSTKILVNEVANRTLENFREGRIETTSYKDSWGRHIQVFVETFANFGIISKAVSAGSDGQYDTHDDIVVVSIYVDAKNIQPPAPRFGSGLIAMK